MATPLTNSRLPVKGIIFGTIGGFSQIDYAGYVIGTDSSGYLPAVLFPPGVINIHVVADLAGRLALAGTVKIGEQAKQVDNNLAYTLMTGTGSNDSDWVPLSPNSITRNTNGGVTVAATGTNQSVNVTPTGTGNLVLTLGAFSGNGSLITTLNASNLSSGTVASARMPAYTGDATSSSGSTALTLASVVAAGTYKSVTVDVKGRVTAGTNPTSAAGYGITNGANIDSWGAKTVPTGTVADLNSVQTFTNKVINANQLTGVVSGSLLPGYTGDVTVTAGSTTTAIASSAVTLGKMANLAANSILGNNTGSSATPIALSIAQTKTLLAITESDVINLTTDLNAKAALASPTFTGTVNLPITIVGTSLTTPLLTVGNTNLHISSVTMSNGAGTFTGTLTNSPRSGVPTKWLSVNDNGTIRYVPSW